MPTPIQAKAIPIFLPAATSWAAPRPVPARRRRSRCRSCTAWRPTSGAPGRRRAARWCSPRRASWRPRSATASPPMAGILKLSCAVVFGGVGQGQQVQSLARGVDVLVATPGRLLDLMGQGLVRLDRLEVFVLDEADRMLDMGFIHDVRKVIAALPERRSVAVLFGDHAARSRRAGGQHPERSGQGRGQSGSVDRRSGRAAGAVRRQGGQACPAQPGAQGRGGRPRARLHAHQARRRPGRAAARPGRGAG